MNTYVTGNTIKQLRESRRLTQAELADRIGVSSKTISKWETARGLPDISLLQPLAQALGISVIELMNGEHIINKNVSANMLRCRFYVCPICGNVIHTTGDAVVSCCGVTLPGLEAEEADEDRPPSHDQAAFYFLCSLCDLRPGPDGEILSRGQCRDPHAAVGYGISVLLLQSARTVQKTGLKKQERMNSSPVFRLNGDQKMISSPARMPAMAEKAGSLLWYMRMDWGRISPKTTYSMAPLAKPRLMVSPRGPISPSQ